jgi:endonuclease/exonuclease/phosphatase family metal-dependent hydrolase
MLAERIRAWQPDVCVLLEYCNTDASYWIRNRLEDDGLIHHIETVNYRNRPEEYGLLLTARWPLTALEAELEGAPPRRWQLARLEHPTTPLVLGAVHVPGRSERPGHKYRCLASLAALAQAWPADDGLLVGDFGAGSVERDEEASYFNVRETSFMGDMAAHGWVDAFRVLHPDEQRFSWWRKMQGQMMGLRVDHAFVSPALAPRLRCCELRYEEDEHWRSDHAALLLDLAHGET